MVFIDFHFLNALLTAVTGNLTLYTTDSVVCSTQLKSRIRFWYKIK